MKLIILDRDGVINQDSEKYIKSVDEWEPISGSLEAIAKLTQVGYKVIVCTNQSGVGRGLISLENLNEIHQKMHKMVELAGGSIAAIVFCPHDPQDKCSCRKPNPNMIIDICNRFNADDISKIMMIGDSLNDLETIDNAGGIPILVKTGNGKKTLSSDKLPAGTMIFENLLEASEYIVSKHYEELNEDK